MLEKKGVDIIHTSAGGVKVKNAVVTAGFEFNTIVYMGNGIKKHVQVPVIVVNQIQTPKRADKIISSGLADFVAIGRDMLTDAHWANKAKKGENIIYCIDCQPKCKRYVKATSCPLFSE